jgi:hypothetical protein
MDALGKERKIEKRTNSDMYPATLVPMQSSALALQEVASESLIDPNRRT